jgi:hypothetical protein
LHARKIFTGIKRESIGYGHDGRVGGDVPERYGKVCYTFDWKEAKDHGEGGNNLGAPLRKRRCSLSTM